MEKILEMLREVLLGKKREIDVLNASKEALINNLVENRRRHADTVEEFRKIEGEIQEAENARDAFAQLKYEREKDLRGTNGCASEATVLNGQRAAIKEHNPNLTPGYNQ